ncbi:glycosyltransferase family 4 protein [Mesorhizobium sp. RP14(2022)]|uniref:Glycosyltransferase family 4 protein n=1 Tax=Mesorhizobium liriopis TaxID=2953882 RepID=A0ABT1C7F1_9HYPH|nr:glycosyltransferase family 4 protein [Mesorhizobium liriopis]
MSDEPLRIVHCFRSPVGGIFRHVRDLAEAQTSAGHLVGIVCDSSTGGVHEDRLFEAIAPFLALGVTRTPMQRHIGFGDLAAARRTLGILHRMKADVLHGHGAKGGVYARLFGTSMRLGGRRVARLYSPHGGSLHYDPRTMTGRMFFALERMMERFGDGVLFVSDHERRTFINKIGEPRGRTTLVYNGLRDEEFVPVEAMQDAADFLYIGMMRDLKGPDLFIDALADTSRTTRLPVSAAMVGAGDDLPRYREQVRLLGLSDHVRFFDPMPARDAFRLARHVVVPSRAEAMPYIVLEALAATKPMIASMVGGIPEIFDEWRHGLVRPTVEQIAQKMREALDDPIQFAGLMPPAESLRARFSAGVMATAIERTYREALRRHS